MRLSPAAFICGAFVYACGCVMMVSLALLIATELDASWVEPSAWWVVSFGFFYIIIFLPWFFIRVDEDLDDIEDPDEPPSPHGEARSHGNDPSRTAGEPPSAADESFPTRRGHSPTH